MEKSNPLLTYHQLWDPLRHKYSTHQHILRSGYIKIKHIAVIFIHEERKHPDSNKLPFIISSRDLSRFALDESEVTAPESY